MLIFGLGVFYFTIARGMFYCRNCRGDRPYRHRSGRRFFTLFFIPVIPLNKTGEHVQCTTCKTRYVVSVLQAPTAAETQSSILHGTRAMVGLMLRTGGMDDIAARKVAVEVVIAAGAQDYDDDKLTADLGLSMDAARQDITRLGGQLRAETRERYLTEAIRVALADGPLTENERGTAEMIAADLGMTKAQALGVITMSGQDASQN
jgi:hypothetical protein